MSNYASKANIKLFNSFIVVNNVEGDVVHYTHKNHKDTYGERDHYYKQPLTSRFPIQQLMPDDVYALTSAQLNGTWYFLTAVNAMTSEFLVDSDLLKHLKQQIVG